MPMSEYTASIRRIGLINSGMFDTLALNFDVRAVHLVGANNVGKTSLIALIQFLFFPKMREMTFVKSAAESLGFYFRPEGSYLLFEVRTLTGSIRTVGIFGTGEADSRVNFVFNGSFDVNTFLTEERTPLPFKDLQANLFDRDFARFDRFERYEEALLGLHTRGEYNVPLFDLSKTNFRLLRRLMQGLLRLDRIDATDVQQFLIRIVEKGAVRTRFNLLQDFEQKYRHINSLRIELRELEALKPVVARYHDLLAKIEETAEKRDQHAAYFFHLSAAVSMLLSEKKKQLARVYDDEEARLEKLGGSVKRLSEQASDARTRLGEVRRQKERFEALTKTAQSHSEALVRQERDRLTHARVELATALAATQPQDAERLKRQLAALTREIDNVTRQLTHKTLQTVWDQAGFDENRRALLRFLVSGDLASREAEAVLADEKSFLQASSRAAEYLDDEGRFRGFGLDLPREVWFVPETDREPLDDRQKRLEREMQSVRTAIEIAENTKRKQAELAEMDAAVASKEAILAELAELRQLTETWKDLESITREESRLDREVARLNRVINEREEESRLLRRQQQATYTALKTAEEKWEQVHQVHASLSPDDGEPPEGLMERRLETLQAEYTQMRQSIATLESQLKQLNSQLAEPKSELEARYERSASDVSFERWLENKADLAGAIHDLEAQLQREYDGIFTVVRAKLSKITQAYGFVESQVAALNKAIHNVRISNITHIGIALEKTALLDAIDQSIPGQLDLFAAPDTSASLEDAHAQVEEYFNQMRNYGTEINLKDMFRLKFSVQFSHQPDPVERYEIHRFESNGTETGVKIVIYLGLIGLLQERKNVTGTRIPFFLDEVGSIDADNLNQLIAYCNENNFLPIFASPEIRKDISHNYLFRRDGNRSYLASVVKITPNPMEIAQDDASDLADHPA